MKVKKKNLIKESSLNIPLDFINIDAIVDSYLETVLWVGNDESSDFITKDLTIHDFDEKSKAQVKEDIIDFLEKAHSQDETTAELASYNESSFGHNFFLSRNRHGSGFFDEDNNKLQEISYSFGPSDFYIGDDGKGYLS